MFDGNEVSSRAIEVLPGIHTIEFYGEFGQGVFPTWPLLRTRCFVSVETRPADRYSYSSNLSKEPVVPGPEKSYRWTMTKLDPVLRDSNGNKVDGMKCEQTCRVFGRKANNKKTIACGESDRSSTDAGIPKLYPHSRESLSEFTRLIKSECDNRKIRGRMDKIVCTSSLPRNAIIFRFRTGKFVYFVVGEKTHNRPGLREEARHDCQNFGSLGELKTCLSGYGWIRLQ